MQRVTGKQFADNAMWKFIELMAHKLIGLAISTILARLLLPETYGIVALTTVFISFADIFILNGFNVALVCKENVSETEYSSVMILSLAFTSMLYVVFFFSAPVIAAFYDTSELESVFRVVTILLFFRSIAAVIRAKGTRELRVREMSIITVIENVSAGLVGLFLAYRGYGVWALVAQLVVASFLDMVLLSAVFRWKYHLYFQTCTVKEMLSFTMFVLASSLMDFLGNNVSSLVVGRAYSSAELGYMNRGNMYPEVIGLNTYSAINSILLPALASRRNDKKAMHDVVREVVSSTGYMLFPLMLGLACVSRNFIVVLLTDKWIPCRIIMVCSCINYLINPIRAIACNVFYALGESKITMRVERLRLVAMLINLVVTIVWLKQSIYVLALTNLMIAFCVMLITQLLVKKEIGYTFCELFSDMKSSLFLSCPMVVVVLYIDFAMPHNILTLLFQIVMGAGLYLLGSCFTKNKNYVRIKAIALERIKKS